MMLITIPCSGRCRRPRRRLLSLISVLALFPVFSAFSSAPLTPPPTPSAVAAPTVVSIGAGEHYTCKLMSDGAVICWGDDTVDGHAVGKTAPPAGIFSQLSVGPHHACALNDGQAVCWGWDEYGQATPYQWGSSQISAGRGTTCALEPYGRMSCWGQDPVPPNDNPVPAYDYVSVGAHHRCMLGYERGATTCRGDNTYGQTNIPEAARNGMVAISAGGGHTCALESSSQGGDVICWGRNTEGQAPALVSGPFTQVSAGNNHTCALRAGDSLVCWGDNTDGQATPPGGSFTQVSAGFSHSCGVRTDSSAICWGSSTYGEITIIDLAPAALPRAVNGADYSQALTASGGAGPYAFSISQGALPAGLSLSGAGVLSGRPVGNGVYSFTVMAADLATGGSGGRSYMLAVADAPVDFLIPDDSGQAAGFGGDRFRVATAIDKDRAVVAASGTHDVYVFERAHGIAQPWRQAAKLDDVLGGQVYGEVSSAIIYVGVSGETLLVVKRFEYRTNSDDMTYLNGGIFRRDPAAQGGWRLEDGFSYGPRYDLGALAAFALDGDTLAAGHPENERTAVPPHVRILRRLADPGQPVRWVEEKIIELDYQRLALSGDTLAVVTDDATVIFERNAGGVGQWGQVRTLGFSGPPALSGNTLLIGDPANDRVRVFRRGQDGATPWGEAAPIVRPDSISAGLEFGSNVLLDGNVAVIAAMPPYGSSDPGWSVVFGLAPGSPGSWKPLLQLYKTTEQLALSGQTLLARFDTSIDTHADQQREIVVTHWLQLASDLEVVAGGQEQVAGELLNPAPQVRVRDINGNPVPGANVSFEGGPGGAFVDSQYAGSALVATDASGIAVMPAYRVVQETGTYTITAKLATNVSLDQEAIAFRVVPRPQGIAIVAGDSQRVPVGTDAPMTPAVRLTDASGEPIAGLRVTFSAPTSGPGGSFAAPSAAGAGSATVRSDAAGVATAPPFRANSIPGHYAIIVTVEGAAAPISIPMTNEVMLYLVLVPRLSKASAALPEPLFQTHHFDGLGAAPRGAVYGIVRADRSVLPGSDHEPEPSAPPTESPIAACSDPVGVCTAGSSGDCPAQADWLLWDEHLCDRP